METKATFTLDPSNVALRLGMCAAALAGVAAPAANAAVITFNTPISIPADVSGVYINLLTGATGSSGSAVSGWDFNPYLANAGTQLGFYWASTAGGVATAATGGTYINLAAGQSVSSASVFTRTILATTGSPFMTTGTRNLGFRFLNETTGLTNYGYLTMTTSASNGFPATITGWTFDNTGAAVTVVPEVSTLTMMSLGALALGAVNLRKVRRQRRQAAAH